MEDKPLPNGELCPKCHHELLEYEDGVAFCPACGFAHPNRSHENCPYGCVGVIQKTDRWGVKTTELCPIHGVPQQSQSRQKCTCPITKRSPIGISWAVVDPECPVHGKKKGT